MSTYPHMIFLVFPSSLRFSNLKEFYSLVLILVIKNLVDFSSLVTGEEKNEMFVNQQENIMLKKWFLNKCIKSKSGIVDIYMEFHFYFIYIFILP